MTLSEAQEQAKLLTELTINSWDATSKIKKEEFRSIFKTTFNNIKSNGFKITKYWNTDDKIYRRIPIYKVRTDNSEQFVSIVDNRSENGYHKGDCTTRCISFCTGVDYAIIQEEQFKNAKVSGIRWRQKRCWETSLLNRGFCEIVFPKHQSVKVFLRKLESYKDDMAYIIDDIIAAMSSRHVAAIDIKQRKILDVWNSTGCRILSIYVPIKHKEAWRNLIDKMFN